MNKFLAALDTAGDFEERPVDLDTFLYDDEYLGKSMRGVELSPIQREIVMRASQIYKRETLIELYGTKKGLAYYEKTTRNLLLLLGKGSGKDFMSRITCAYIVHKLLCLRDPSGYYGKPTGDQIDIVNMALNSDQAYQVFFNAFKRLLNRSPWFSRRIVNPHIKEIEFQKEIHCHSLHSKPEGAEGLNIIAVVLDEIDGFETETGSEDMYKSLSHTVTSRFPQLGKVLCLSFPRSKSGWMMTRYDMVVHEREVHMHEHVYKLNSDLPDGTEGNEFTVKWTEDEILSYRLDNWFAIKAPTFRVNPTTHIDNYKDSFLEDLENNTAETLLRVCANPPDHLDSVFFKNQEKIKEVFKETNGWDQTLQEIIIPGDFDREYFIHVDLSKVSDRTVVALGHVSHWQQIQIGNSIEQDAKPFIVIDLFRVWEPTQNDPVDNVEVTNFILELSRKFNLVLVTFDRWGSFDIMEFLNDRGVQSERQSLDRASYEEFKYAVQDLRLKGPHDKRFLKELKNLIITKTGKVDHPDGREHYNDISEAVCGVINNCVKNALEELDVRLVTVDTVKADTLRERERHDKLHAAPQQADENLASFMTGLGVIG